MAAKKQKRTIEPHAPKEDRQEQQKASEEETTETGEKAESVPAGTSKENQGTDTSFPIVAIGASAGGLEALRQLFENLPADTGMGFVVIQHLAPDFKSLLPEILARSTSLPVHLVTEGMEVKPNQVYVIPPNATMGIINRTLHLIQRIEVRGKHMPFDYFLRTLAEDCKHLAIGVILSGTDSDGTLGLRAIKAESGLTFSQSPESAKFDGMPHSAIDAGVVDYVLSPEDIAKELGRMKVSPQTGLSPLIMNKVLFENEEILNKLFVLMRSATGVDFTHYKPTTIRRRIARRMILHKIDQLSDYIPYLKDHPAEIEGLYEDLLINITHFFRDAETFEVLKEEVLPRLLANQSSGGHLRIWVAGCSSGEETYSIAIALLEYMRDMDINIQVQIFATDISERSIQNARVGFYPENITLDVSPERLRRFFNKVDGGYSVNKAVRDMCIFARQDLTTDPPFSRIDLITCRNMLIYLGLPLQKKVFRTFHYALQPHGVLLLGNSETVGAGLTDLFTLANKKHKIYYKQPTARTPHLHFSTDSLGTTDLHAVETADPDVNLFKETDHIVLGKYAPAGVLINDQMDILQFRGHTGPYLEPAPGVASFNLLKMVREELMMDVRTALLAARKQNSTIRREGIKLTSNGQYWTINIEVISVRPTLSKERYFLVLFEETTSARTAPVIKKEKKRRNLPADEDQLRHLLQELETTKDYIQSLVGEHEGTSEELRSALEELQSSNEELQSSNEELETAKEELQSNNEELTTVNEELHDRNQQLSQVNNDLVNLLASVNIPIVMLGNDLRVRLSTPLAEKLLNLIPTDIGRKISDIRPNLLISNLEDLILDVIDTLVTKQIEVQDREGCWYSMRIRPYRTVENQIDGVVIVLMDIDAIRKAQTKRGSRKKTS